MVFEEKKSPIHTSVYPVLAVLYLAIFQVRLEPYLLVHHVPLPAHADHPLPAEDHRVPALVLPPTHRHHERPRIRHLQVPLRVIPYQTDILSYEHSLMNVRASKTMSSGGEDEKSAQI
jgi:hypothetical protein